MVQLEIMQSQWLGNGDSMSMCLSQNRTQKAVSFRITEPVAHHLSHARNKKRRVLSHRAANGHQVQ